MNEPLTGHGTSASFDDDLVDFGAILLTLWERRVRIVASVAFAVLLALAYLNTAEYEYRATMSVIPVTDEGGAEVGGGLGSLASLAGVSLAGVGDSVQFQLFLDGLTTRETAAEVLGDEALLRVMFSGDWDADSGQWREPSSLRRSLYAFGDRLVGRPVVPWRAPDAARVEGFLVQHVNVDEGSGSIVEISVEHRDRDFAVALLKVLHEVVDERLRGRALERASTSADYLRGKLEEVRISEVRLALAQALSAREQERMLASSSLPFAAEPISGPTAPFGPSKPVPLLIVVLGLTLGLLVGIAVALLGGGTAPSDESADGS